MSKIKNTIFIVIGALCAVVFVGAVAQWNYSESVSRYRREVAKITISEVDLSALADGRYLGEHDVNFVSAKVAVTIKDGRIQSVELLEHKNERGKAAEAIVDKMVDEQRIDVDAITTATNSSKVIKKAVENALTKPLTEKER